MHKEKLEHNARIVSSGNLKLSRSPTIFREVIELDGGAEEKMSFEITKCFHCRAELIHGITHDCKLGKDLFGDDMIAQRVDRGNQFDRKRSASPVIPAIGSGYKRFTRDTAFDVADDPIEIDGSEDEYGAGFEEEDQLDEGFNGDPRNGMGGEEEEEKLSSGGFKGDLRKGMPKADS